MDSNYSVFDYIDLLNQIKHHKEQKDKSMVNGENKNKTINIPDATIKQFHYRPRPDIGDVHGSHSINSRHQKYRRHTNTKQISKQDDKTGSKDDDESDTSEIEEIFI